MPMRYEIDPQARLVRSHAWGVLTADEVRGYLKALGADPGFDRTHRHLGDCRGVTEVQVESDAIREVARVRLSAPEARRAMVATSDVVYRLGRMYQQIGGFDDDAYQVFQSLHEALAFLGLTAADAGVSDDDASGA